MATYKQFEDLPVWKKAKELGVSIYSLTKGNPFARDYHYIAQVLCHLGLSINLQVQRICNL
ncbi:MAG: four helix bundle protein [Candidatus Brocadiaceae bacterium]|nr:four helix bundle protein [Candidatus Brocadiaceae bacterium]